MTYEYACPGCAHRFDVIKSVADMERAESCPKCKAEASRQFVPSRVYLAGTAVQHAEFNPAFGCVVKNKRHRDYLAESRGMVEIGNDFKEPDRIHKKFEVEREEKRDASYEQALKEII